MAAQPSTPAAKPAASPYYIDLTKDENWGEVNDVDGGIVAEFFQNIDNIIQATNMGKEKREEVFKQGKFFVKRFRSEIIPKVQSAKRTKTAKADKTAKDDDDTDSDKSDTDEKPKKNKKKVDDDPDYDPAVGDLPTEDEMEEDDDAAEEKRQAQIEAAKYAPVQQIIAAVKSLPATLSVPMKVGDSNLMDIAAAKSQKAVAIQTSATDKALQHHNFKSATNFISNRAVFNKMEKINKWLYNRARKYSDMYKSGHPIVILACLNKPSLIESCKKSNLPLVKDCVNANLDNLTSKRLVQPFGDLLDAMKANGPVGVAAALLKMATL